MCQNTASNIACKVDIYHWDEIPQLDQTKVTMLDVMTPKEYQKGHIPGAINIPVDELRKRIGETTSLIIIRNRTIVV